MKTYNEPFCGSVLPITRNGDYCPQCDSDSTFEAYCGYCRRPKFEGAREPFAGDRQMSNVIFVAIVVFIAVILFAQGVWSR